MRFSLRSNPRRLVFFILALALGLTLISCKQTEKPAVENVEDPVSTSGTDISTNPPTNPTNPTEAATETQIASVPATMGTIDTARLNIRQDAGSNYDAIGNYVKGDRVEILETKTVDDTVWGRTSKGWIGMGYVRMDGTPTTVNTESGNANAVSIVSDGNCLVLGYGVVDLKALNVRSGPDTSCEKIKEVSQGVRYAYYQEVSGWVRIEDGWVSTTYFYLEGRTAEDAMFGTVTAENLNIRTGPDTDFKSNGTYKKGEAIDILAQVNGWGYTEKGWVNMAHVESRDPVYTTGTATVTTGLNIRKEANADSEKVDVYKEGDRVTILEVKDGWGRTDKGWINLKYVKYD